jgi:quercetin dioxygenase-like cupin family protein
MILTVEHWDEQTDGSLSDEAMRLKLQGRGYHVSRHNYLPGTCFPDHSHDVDKIDAVLTGQFRMTLGGHSVILKAGDCLAVPRGTVHSAEVVGNESVVSLDAVKY